MSNAAVIEKIRSKTSRRFSSVLWIFWLSSCAPHRELGQFRAYVEEFEMLSAQFGKPVYVDDLIMEFVEQVAPGGVAECITGTMSTPTVRILKEGWRAYSEVSRKLMVFHELGHCVLQRHHDNRLLPNGRPASIMHIHNVAARIFLENETYYLCELFGAPDCDRHWSEPDGTPPPIPRLSRRRDPS